MMRALNSASSYSGLSRGSAALADKPVPCDGATLPEQHPYEQLADCFKRIGKAVNRMLQLQAERRIDRAAMEAVEGHARSVRASSVRRFP